MERIWGDEIVGRDMRALRAVASLAAVAATAAACSQPAAARGTRLRAVLFDIDGTLFDSDRLHFAVFQEVLQEYGFQDGTPINEAFFMERISGRQNALICKDLFPSWDLSEGAAFSAYKERRFRELAAERLPSLATAGLAKLLDYLDGAGVRCAAVTNAPRANAELMLGAIDRLDWFAPLVIGDECTRAKPHPEPYLAAMRELGVAADECVAIEDSPAGAAAACAAGVRTLGITSTQAGEALTAAGCAVLVRDFDDPALWSELQRWESAQDRGRPAERSEVR